MATSIPTLTAEGFVSAPDRKADRILANALASDYSQSNLFRGNVTSIQYLIHQYQFDAFRLGTEIRNSLETLFGRYFDQAVAKVDVVPMADNPAKLDIRLGIIVTQGTYRYQLNRLLSVQEGVIGKLLPIHYTD